MHHLPKDMEIDPLIYKVRINAKQMFPVTCNNWIPLNEPPLSAQACPQDAPLRLSVGKEDRGGDCGWSGSKA